MSYSCYNASTINTPTDEVFAMPMRTAYSYVRFSSKKQAKGRSKGRQTETCEDFCRRHQLKLSTQSYQDLGISAWKGRNFHAGALGAFLKAVRDERVAPGSVLVVESLDRITRDKARKAQRIVEEIIEEGITIATIEPERFYDVKAIDDPFTIVEMLFIFVRANEESNTKSKRVRDSWSKRRAKAAVKKMTRRCPSWLTLVDGEFIVDETKAESVRTIVRMSADGHGAPSILKHLHDTNTPNPQTGLPKWSLAYVQLLMKDRRIIGEMQPHHMVDGKRQELGVAIDGYFPAIIDLATFNRAQAARENRSRNHVTQQGKRINLFSGLIFDPVTNSSWNIAKSGSGRAQRLLPLAVRNKQAKGTGSVDYEEVERVVLEYIEGLDLASLAPRKGHDELGELRATLADTNARIKAFADRITADDADELFAKVRELKTERDEIAAKISSMTHDAASLSHAADNALEVIAAMRDSTGEERHAIRLRLKAHLASVIERIEMIAVPYWKWTVGVLDIRLVNGMRRREVTHQSVLPHDIREALLLRGFDLPLSDAKSDKLRELLPGVLEKLGGGFELRVVKKGDETKIIASRKMPAEEN